MRRPRVRTRLWDWRRRRGLSQGDLAKLAGISQSRLCLFERGHAEPSPAALKALAAALGCRVVDLIDDRTASTVMTEPMAVGASDLLPVVQRLADDVAQIAALLRRLIGDKHESNHNTEAAQTVAGTDAAAAR